MNARGPRGDTGMAKIEVKVPDIGGYDDVPVIELLVEVGDTVAIDQGLATLESDKATMEVPSSTAGVVSEIRVKVDDKVSEGAVVAVIEADGGKTDGDDAAGGQDSGGKDKAGASGDGQAGKEAPSKAEAGSGAAKAEKDPAPAPAKDAPRAAAASGRKADVECAVLVLGAGPGGYTAAFRAADLGMDTVLVERYP